VPNPQARSLRTTHQRRRHADPDIRNPFYPELVKTVQSELETVGLAMLIFNTDVPAAVRRTMAQLHAQIGNRRVDGLIVGDFGCTGCMIRCCSSTCRGLHRRLAEPCGRQASGSTISAGLSMGEYLAKKGHRRVAQVTAHPSSRRRCRGAGFARAWRWGALPIAELRFEGSYLALRLSASSILRSSAAGVDAAIFWHQAVLNGPSKPWQTSCAAGLCTRGQSFQQQAARAAGEQAGALRPGSIGAHSRAAVVAEHGDGDVCGTECGSVESAALPTPRVVARRSRGQASWVAQPATASCRKAR